ncbi:phage head closure protein [Robinsoniella peoriensis]|uniref:phage head closure protein n=1 Tax=Robinsoniella peoriensis TaxID=180332 RepID=UPI0036400C9A
MEVALMNVRIIFQKNAVTVDAIGNHINGWTDEYSCYATVSGEGGSEKAAAGLVVEDSDLSFTVRYCKKAAQVTADGYRVVFADSLYNIVSIDHLNYKKKALKFKCEKARR